MKPFALIHSVSVLSTIQEVRFTFSILNNINQNALKRKFQDLRKNNT